MEIAVRDQTIALLKDDTLVRKSGKSYRVVFVFDSSWDGFKKTALFHAGAITVSVALTDNVCDIPPECLENAGAMLKVLIYGVKDGKEKASPWCQISRILYDTYIDIPVGPTPTPTPTGEVGRLCEDFADALNSEYTEEELKDKTLSEVIGDMDELGNTASDEEVEDALNDVWGPEEP